MAQDEAKAAARNEVDDGVQAFRQAHYEDAIGHFEQAVSLDPDLVLARMYLAATYMQVFQPGIGYSRKCHPGNKGPGTVFRNIAQQPF